MNRSLPLSLLLSAAVLATACSKKEDALPPPAAAEPASPPPAEPDAISDLPGEALPKVFRAKAETGRKVREAATVGVVWGVMAVAMGLMIGAAVLFRVDVVKAWPRSAAAYAGIGLPVNSLGLVIEGEMAALYCFVFLFIACRGAGKWSVDPRD